MSTEHVSHVGMSEIKFAETSRTAFVVPGLGSCIALVIYQPERRLAGMAHVLLPDSNQAVQVDAPGKFADTAVPCLISELVERGAQRRHLIAKMAGGAQMFQSGPGPSVGARNVEAVTQALAEHRVPLAASDVGGKQGRSIRFEVETERYFVRHRLGQERILE